MAQKLLVVFNLWTEERKKRRRNFPLLLFSLWRQRFLFSPRRQPFFSSSLEGITPRAFIPAMEKRHCQKVVHHLKVLAFFLAFSNVAASRAARDLSIRSRLREGGDQVREGGGKQGVHHCSLVSRDYYSSKLEQAWLDNARKWSEDFCSHMGAFSKETQKWLDAIAGAERGEGGFAAAEIDDNDVFSSFVSVYDCSGETVTKKTWIEPLSHGLRHPRALCGGNANLEDRDYLLLSSRDDFVSLAMTEGGRGGFSSEETKGARSDFSSSKARSNHAAYSRSADTQSTSAADSLLSSRAQMDHAAGLRTATNGIFIRAAGSRTASNGISTGAADFLTSSSTSSKRRHDLGGACVERPCQNIFVDLGASTWNTGLGGPSQSWFYDSYKRHGLEFDRLLLWEAEPTPASAVFSSLPKELWHKYQYFNWPASSNSSDPSSPLRIIKKIAQPGDFVVLKLDIDTPKVEMAILRELLNDPDLLELVDEFFFEYHVLFGPMNNAWFKSENPSPPPTRETLADSYAVFRKMREKGLRAHSWV